MSKYVGGEGIDTAVTGARGLQYADEGCIAATAKLGAQSHCLACPFLKCLEDSPTPRVKAYQASVRTRDMIAAEEQGKTLIEIAQQFGVSYRTVWNSLRRNKDGHATTERSG